MSKPNYMAYFEKRRPEMKSCENCPRLTCKVCKRCKKSHFCSAKCQKECWKEHKKTCKESMSRESWRYLYENARHHIPWLNYPKQEPIYTPPFGTPQSVDLGIWPPPGTTSYECYDATSMYNNHGGREIKDNQIFSGHHEDDTEWELEPWEEEYYSARARERDSTLQS